MIPGAGMYVGTTALRPPRLVLRHVVPLGDPHAEFSVPCLPVFPCSVAWLPHLLTAFRTFAPARLVPLYPSGESR
jgi:hypothetical protein